MAWHGVGWSSVLSTHLDIRDMGSMRAACFVLLGLLALELCLNNEAIIMTKDVSQQCRLMTVSFGCN